MQVVDEPYYKSEGGQPNGVATLDGSGQVPASQLPTAFGAGSFGGSASASSLGLLGYLTIPYSGTITGWQVIGDVSGNCVFDVWLAPSGIIPTVANTITGTEKPTLTAQQINSDLSLSTWTTAVTAGDIIAINLDSASVLSKAWLTVFITKN